MFNFNLCVPTEFHFGKYCEDDVAKVISQYGQKILLVYGSERIFKNGVGNKVQGLLEEAGIEVIRHGGVIPNPLVSHVMEAVKKCQDNNVDVILGIGGGSVMDTAKAIASKFADTDGKILPIVNIVTAPATSSESNPLFVLTDDETHEKTMQVDPRVMPKVAFLDPVLTYSLPDSQTAAGAFDAFCHAFERFFDLSRNSKLLDEMTASVMRTIVQTLPCALAKPDNYEYRSDLMLAAAVAHNDLLGPGGDFACHEISHAVTEAFGLSHGEALAVVLPAWMNAQINNEPERFALFAKMVFDVNCENSVEAAKIGIDKLLTFINLCGLPVAPVDSEIDKNKFTSMILKGREAIGGGFKALDADELSPIVDDILRFV